MELCFLFSGHHRIIINICTRFCDYIAHGFRVVRQRKFTKGYITPLIVDRVMIFVVCTSSDDVIYICSEFCENISKGFSN